MTETSVQASTTTIYRLPLDGRTSLGDVREFVEATKYLPRSARVVTGLLGIDLSVSITQLGDAKGDA